jgi:hypothetical protein
MSTNEVIRLSLVVGGLETVEEIAQAVHVLVRHEDQGQPIWRLLDVEAKAMRVLDVARVVEALSTSGFAVTRRPARERDAGSLGGADTV